MIREKKLSVRDAIKIETGGKEYKVKKALVGIRDRFVIETDGKNLKAHGNIVDHEYEIEQDGDKVAEVSKKWFRVRDTYGVEIDARCRPGADLVDHRGHRQLLARLTQPPTTRPAPACQPRRGTDVSGR